MGHCYKACQTVYHGRQLGLKICNTTSHNLQSNRMAQASVKTYKRDYAYVKKLNSAETVRQKITKWFDDYKEIAPHKGLRMQAPR